LEKVNDRTNQLRKLEGIEVAKRNLLCIILIDEACFYARQQ